MSVVKTVAKNNLSLHGKNQAQIPKVDERSKKPVVVADLGAFFEGKENLIPDPFIVVLKAAASWSTFCSQDLFI